MAVNQTGPSTTQTPYLVGTVDSVSFTSLLSAGDAVRGSFNPDGTSWRMVGIPDGLGAFDNNDGTLTVLMNQEIGGTSGVVREHGSAGSFVSRLVVDKQTLQVLSAGDLAQDVFNFTSTGYVEGTTAWSRFCSGDLPETSAFFDSASGLGTTARIYMTGEESGPEGRAFGFIATGTPSSNATGDAFELPRLGNFSFENVVANPGTGAKTVVIGTDDSTPGQVYLYVGDKQMTGTDVDKAGLTNGKLFGIKVSTFTDETNATTVPTEGAAFSLQEMGSAGDVSALTGAQLQAESELEGVTEFLRPEDGQWDPTNPNRFYFVTTNNATSPSRLWALDFTDARNPELGGTVKMLLAGNEGQVMMDNMTVTAEGRVIIQEDPGNNARLARVYEYDPASDTLVQLAQHDPARFAGPTSPFTQDEESSGVIDVSDILGGPGRQAFLLDVQAHYNFGDPEIVEGGQLDVMYIDRSISGASGNNVLTGSRIDDLIRGGEGTDTLSGAAGADLIYGNQGGDLIYGNQNSDVIYGGQGNDVAYGGQGNDVLQGNLGDDNLFGNLGSDLIYGNQGNDSLFGGQDDDVLYGGQGNDVLSGNLGNDRLIGGAGADRFVFGRNEGTDTVLDFNSSQGDRLDLQGQSYTIRDTPEGMALDLSGGGAVLLNGIEPNMFSNDFVVM